MAPLDGVRGASGLASELTAPMNELVETMHHSIARGRGPLRLVHVTRCACAAVRRWRVPHRAAQ